MLPPKTTQQQPNIKMENMTRDQLKKIERSMKRPQFMGLLNQYMVEISDPKNKDEYDTYLRQMQEQGELPKHLKLVKINPEFCYRTRIVSSSNKRHQMKFFVNVCSSDLIEKPSFDMVPGQDGKMGQAWKIPNSMGKIRYDQDRHGNVCQTVDAAFHSDTFKMMYNPAFQAMVINITLESATKQLGQRKETLSKDYEVLKNRKCKGNAPALLPIRVIDGKLYNKGEGPQQRNLQGKETKLQKEINKQKQQFQKEKQQKSKKQKTQNEQDNQEIQQNQQKMITDLDKGPQRPKYSSIYTYPIDYTEYMMQGPSVSISQRKKNKQQRKLPTAFNIEFQVPKIQKISEVTITLNENKIIIDGKDKYFIDLSLEDEFKIRYKLKKEEVKAKFDKKKKILRVIYPVDQSFKLEQQMQQNDANNSAQQEQIQDEKVKINEQETWKQKVLQMQEPKVALQIVNKEEFEKKPQPAPKKLIEQIDQDDYMEQKETETAKQKTEIKMFTVRDYYDKNNQETETGESQQIIKPIEFLFQETADKILLIAKMPNYDKSEIQISYLPFEMINSLESEELKGHIMVKRTIKNKLGITQNHILHKKLLKQLLQDQNIIKISHIQRVGFIAFFLEKNVKIKGKYFEKKSIQDITQNYLSGEKVSLQNFEARISDIQAIKIQIKKREQAEANIIKNEDQLRTDKSLENEKESVTLSRNQQQKPQIYDKQMKENNSDSKIEEVDAKITQNIGIFSQLMPQFIEFNASFVDTLN